jgi:hypothetical protein
MAYIGRQLARGENKLFDDISSSFNGSTTVFNLTVSSVATSTATAFQLFVSLGGVMQKPNTDFTTAGNQITFTTAPAAGLSCWIMMQGDTIDQAAIPDASVTPSKIAGSGDFAFPADVRLNDGDGSHYVGFQAPTTVSTNKIWTLPAADGSANQYLKTDGSGTLSWGSDSTSDPSKMPLAGGTFTGDVTFTGDASNGLWDKSASAFVANLTGTASGNAVLTGSTNNTIATVTGANAIQGEAKLTFDGSRLTQTISTAGHGVSQTAAGNHYINNIFDANISDAGTVLTQNLYRWNGTDVAAIKIRVGLDTTNKDDGQITFETSSADNIAERMRITNAGNVGIGTSSPNAYANQTTLTINGTDNSRLDLEVAGTLRGSIWTNSGGIGIDAGANDIELYAGSAERFKIGSSGQLGIGGATYGSSGQVLTSGGASAAPQWATPSAGAWTKIASGSVTSGTARTVTTNGITSTYEHYKLIFHCINESGQQFGIDVSTNGGSSWVSASGSNYSINYFGHYNGSNMNGGDNGRPFAELKTGANSDNYSGYITFSGAHRTDEVHSFQSSFSAWNNGNTRHGIYQCALAYKATTAFNGIRFMSDASGDGWSLLTYTLLGCEM